MKFKIALIIALLLILPLATATISLGPKNGPDGKPDMTTGNNIKDKTVTVGNADANTIEIQFSDIDDDTLTAVDVDSKGESKGKTSTGEPKTDKTGKETGETEIKKDGKTITYTPRRKDWGKGRGSVVVKTDKGAKPHKEKICVGKNDCFYFEIKDGEEVHIDNPKRGALLGIGTITVEGKVLDEKLKNAENEVLVGGVLKGKGKVKDGKFVDDVDCSDVGECPAVATLNKVVVGADGSKHIATVNVGFYNTGSPPPIKGKQDYKFDPKRGGFVSPDGKTIIVPKLDKDGKQIGWKEEQINAQFPKGPKGSEGAKGATGPIGEEPAPAAQPPVDNYVPPSQPISNTVPTPDTTPPTATITSPQNGLTVPYGITMPFAGTATDNVGVRLELNGQTLTTIQGNAWNVPVSATIPGVNTLTAVVFDAAGNKVTLSTTVMVQAPSGVAATAIGGAIRQPGQVQPCGFFCTIGHWFGFS